jgi:hypothetical protein
MTLDSLKNSNIHTYLIEEIRSKVVVMGGIKWKIQFCCYKVHAGIQGNEIANTLAKEAAMNVDIIRCYRRVPKSVVLSELSGISVEKQQRECDQTTKGTITKEYFPVVAERLKMKINLTQNFTTMVTGNSNRRSCLHRFKIIKTPICPCGTTDQTREHSLFECELLNKERDNIISKVLKTDVWPISKDKMIRKQFKTFDKFTNEISFDKLNEV